MLGVFVGIAASLPVCYQFLVSRRINDNWVEQYSVKLQVDDWDRFLLQCANERLSTAMPGDEMQARCTYEEEIVTENRVYANGQWITLPEAKELLLRLEKERKALIYSSPIYRMGFVSESSC